MQIGKFKSTFAIGIWNFLGALSFAQREGCRYYAVFSGLPGVAINLKKAKTYTERMFTFRNVSNLSKNDSIMALERPLKKTDFSFDFEKIHPLLLNELDISFFEDRFERASDNEQEVLFSMAKIDSEIIKTSAILANMNIDASLLMEFLKRLNNKGLIFRPKKGRYSFTIPLIKDFLIRKQNINKH